MVIYRKYRPRSFREIIGQDDIVKTLQNSIRKKSISHAYLFAGPRGTGKTSLSRIFAKAINCTTKGSVEPCNRCKTCQAIAGGRSLDLIEIDAASNRGIDEVRALRESVKVAPTLGSYKVYIVDEVHMLTKEAFNALLKTLEEPPEYVVFILATTEVHKVLPTILSRVQRFDFKLLGDEDLKQRLRLLARKEKAKIKDEVLDFVVYKAGGSARNAETLLQQILVAGFKSISSIKRFLGIQDDKLVFDFLDKLLTGDGAEALGLINSLEQEGASLPEFNKNSLLVLQSILQAKLGLEGTDTVKNFSEKFTIKSLVEFISLFLESGERLKMDIPTSLPLEILVAKVCAREEELSPQTEKQTFSPQSQAKEVAKKPGSPPPDGVKTEKNKTLEPTPQPQLDPNVLVDMETIKERWSEILQGLQPLNHSLAAFFRFGRPLSIESNKLKVAFAHSFHKETIDNLKNKQMIEQVLQDLFKTVIVIETILEKEVEVNSKSGDMTDKALEMFGGKVVE